MVKSQKRVTNRRKSSTQKSRVIDHQKENNEEFSREITEEDYEFLDEGYDISFLANLDEKSLIENGDGSNRTKRKLIEEEEEEAFEKMPRRQFKEQAVREKLPTRDENGTWKSSVEIIDVPLDCPSEIEEAHSHDDRVGDMVDHAWNRRDRDNNADISSLKSIPQKVEYIGTIATEIVENTEDNIGNLKVLLKFGKDAESKVVKLSFLTQLMVYKNILPGYRIRTLSEKEKNGKVTKDLMKIREYENILLTNYQRYLQLLDESMANQKLAKTAMKCMCELLKHAPHFNFRLNLINSIVLHTNHVTLGESCRECLGEILRDDTHGDISLDIVKIISKHLKKTTYFKPVIVDILLNLRLSANLVKKIPEKPKRQEGHISRKNRKLKKELDEVDKEMKEASAVVDLEERMAIQSEILQLLFSIYFRILKSNASHFKLLPSALKGIEKYAHLISVDYFTTIALNINRVLEESYELLSTDTRFRCVKTCFLIYSLQESLEFVDMKEMFYKAYKLFQVHEKLRPEYEDTLTHHTKALLNLMFNSRAQTDINQTRLAAFLKRLCIILGKVSKSECFEALLDTIKSLYLKSPPKVRRMILEDEEERPTAMGAYDSNTDQLDICNPFASWFSELHALKNHENSQIRRSVNQAFTQIFNKYQS